MKSGSTLPLTVSPLIVLGLASRLLLRVQMMLSSEALEIIAYLNTAPGKLFSMAEISRRAGGRGRFVESPGWARNLMSHLVDAGLIEVNARGHYRVPVSEHPHTQPDASAMPTYPAPRKSRAKIVGDDYFPTRDGRVVEGDYFPSTE
jgi:hypothetical protein